MGPGPALAGVYLLLLANLGVLGLGIGVLGEYVVRIHHQSKRRPLWLVDYALNLGPGQLPHPLDRAAVTHSLDHRDVDAGGGARRSA